MLPINQLYHADCFNLLKEIDNESINLILTDVPYSTTEASFDKQKIDFNLFFQEVRRILTKNGTLVTTCCFPFAAYLIVNNLDLFKYDTVWIKSKATNFANAKNRPLRKHENIIVFSKGTTANGSNNKMTYNPQGLIKIDKQKKYTRNKPSIMGLRDNWKGNEYVQEFTNYPNTLLEFQGESGLHETQKPLDMYEFLVKTYSNPGDLILEPFMGSGTTILACKNNNRNFIGIEKEQNYYNISKERLGLV